MEIMVQNYKNYFSIFHIIMNNFMKLMKWIADSQKGKAVCIN